MNKRLAINSTLVACLLALSACGGSGGDDGGTNNPPSAGAAGSLSGLAVDTRNGAVLGNVLVSTDSGVSAVTNSGGEFTLSNVPVDDRVVVRFELNGYEDAFRIANVDEGVISTLSASMSPVGSEATVDPSAGGQVTLSDSPAQVTFDAGSINASGPVTVTLTDIAPGSSADNMPGDFTALDGGAERQIESFGAISVNLTDSAGQKVDLSDGRTATIRIPVSSRSSNISNTIPLFHFDEDTGLWVEEGTATLAGDGSYYEGTVAHFTTWNADKYYDSVNITGCVVDETNTPVSGVRITSTGVDYTGTSTETSNAAGQFTIPVRKNSTLTLRGARGSSVTSTRAFTTAEANLDQTDPSQCLRFAGSSEQALSITLTWGELPGDLDSHLWLVQNDEIAFYSRGSLESEPFANLDVDDTSSFGPEVVTVLRPRVGIYRYYVHNFSNSQPGTSGSPARVELSLNGVTRVFTPPSGETTGQTNYWHVFDVSIASDCSATVIPATGSVYSIEPPERPAEPNDNAPFCSARAAVR